MADCTLYMHLSKLISGSSERYRSPGRGIKDQYPDQPHHILLSQSIFWSKSEQSCGCFDPKSNCVELKSTRVPIYTHYWFIREVHESWEGKQGPIQCQNPPYSTKPTPLFEQIEQFCGYFNQKCNYVGLYIVRSPVKLIISSSERHMGPERWTKDRFLDQPRNILPKQINPILDKIWSRGRRPKRSPGAQNKGKDTVLLTKHLACTHRRHPWGSRWYIHAHPDIHCVIHRTHAHQPDKVFCVSMQSPVARMFQAVTTKSNYVGLFMIKIPIHTHHWFIREVHES